MHRVKRIIAASVAGATMVVIPAVAAAAPAFASSKEYVGAVSADHDAQKNLAHATRTAEFGTTHAQRDVLRVTKTGDMLFGDDGNHRETFHRDRGATGGDRRR